MIDNTWAAGVLFKALEFGIDISIQARHQISDRPFRRDGGYRRVQ